MGRKKISILIENEINTHQIYVPVFYLIEINILVAFWGQKSWKNVYSAASPSRMQVTFNNNFNVSGIIFKAESFSYHISYFEPQLTVLIFQKNLNF